jgi:hypothetical protein
LRRRRLFATAGAQLIQRMLIRPALGVNGPVRAALPIRLLNRIPVAQRIPARMVGGLRLEYLI